MDADGPLMEQPSGEVGRRAQGVLGLIKGCLAAAGSLGGCVLH